MFTTAKELEEVFRNTLAGLDADGVFDNKDAIVARLKVMGMYGLAKELSEAEPGKNDAAALSRLYRAFGLESFGSIIIEDLSPDTVEFESIYGLADPATNQKGIEISFTVKDASGRFPLSISQENIRTSFSLAAREQDMSCVVKSCIPSADGMSGLVTLLAHVSGEAFSSEGQFVLRIEVFLGKAVAASAKVRFTVKNSFPTFFREDVGALAAESDYPPLRPKRYDSPKLQEHQKQIVINKQPVQSKHKNLRLAFENPRAKEGEIPLVLCGNAAFRPGVPTHNSVVIAFRLPVYKQLERRLKSNGLIMRLPPESSVWVEWDDLVMVYLVQFKGLMTES